MTANTPEGAEIVIQDSPSPQEELAPPRRRPLQLIGARLEALALPLTWLFVFIAFSVLKTDIFLTWANVSSMLSSQVVVLVVTLGLIIPLTADDFDLSIAAVVGLSAMTVAILNSNHGWPILLAILAALLVGVLVGLINGLLTVYIGIQSLVVTLGMSTLVSGITLWVSDARTITGVSSTLIDFVIRHRIFGIPLEFYYGLILTIFLWYIYRFTPVGQRLLIVGRNRDVARLSGINVNAIRVGAMVVSSMIGAIAGVIIVGTSGSAGPATGLDLLLPAFAAAFLGSTTIRPGRFNPWGTLVAVYFLVTGITGLQLLGARSYVQNLFYGTALIAAVAFSQMVKKRRAASHS